MAPEQQDANQAALTAEWSVALEKEAPAEGATAAAGAEKSAASAAVAAAEEAAAQWAAMAGEGGVQSNKGGAKRHPQSG